MKLVYICRTGFKNGGLESGPSLKMGAFRAATHGKNRGFWSYVCLFLPPEVFKYEMGIYLPHKV